MQVLRRTLMIGSMAALAVAPSRALAQMGMTVWAGAGGSSQDYRMTFGRDTKQVGVQVGVPLLPIAVRADAMLFGSRIDTDALSYNVNAVLQMRLPVLQPYALVGRGRYATSPTTKMSGFNVGAGARLGLGRFGVFGEIRRHDPISRTVTVLGLTF